MQLPSGSSCSCSGSIIKCPTWNHQAKVLTSCVLPDFRTWWKRKKSENSLPGRQVCSERPAVLHVSAALGVTQALSFMSGTVGLMKSHVPWSQVQHPSLCEYVTIHKLMVVQGSQVNFKHILPILPKNPPNTDMLFHLGTLMCRGVRPCFLQNSKVSIFKLLLLPQRGREFIHSATGVWYLQMLHSDTS